MTWHRRAVLSPSLVALLLGAPMLSEGRQTPETNLGLQVREARRVTDETGRSVAMPRRIERIVSLAPNLTEIVYALGLQDRLVAVTDYTDAPPEAAKKPSVGAPLSPSLERIVALRPDLVLATRGLNRRATVESLDRLGIPVYATDPRTVEGTLASIARIAELTGADAAGERIVAGLRARLVALRQRLEGRPPARVLFVVWEEPLISAGPHTFLADALHCAGAESVIRARQDWPRISLEEIVRLQPDELVFPMSHSATARETAAELRTRRGWRDLQAVQRGRVVLVSDAINRPSPHLVDAIEQLARALHPEAFPDQTVPEQGTKQAAPSGGASTECSFSLLRVHADVQGLLPCVR